MRGELDSDPLIGFVGNLTGVNDEMRIYKLDSDPLIGFVGNTPRRLLRATSLRIWIPIH